MERADSLGILESEVGVLLRRIKRVIGERARAVHPDLHPSTYMVLTHICEEGPVRASALVDRFEIDKGAISRSVNHLLDLGLIAVEPDPGDRRANLLSVTAEAVSRIDEIVAHRRKLLDEKLGDWSAEELARFVSDLGRYNEALNRF